MPAENLPKPTVSQRKQADAPSRPQPSPAGGSPSLQSGLETLRDNHC